MNIIDDNIEQELDLVEQNLKLLRDGIPLRDNSDEIVGWMEKPDRAANEFFLKTRGKHRGYNETPNFKTNTPGKKWHEI